MTHLDGEQVLLRIFIGESDHHDGRPLYQWLLEYLRRKKISGATVLRGIAGFGAKSHLHTANILRLSHDLPIIIEAVDTEINIQKVLPEIENTVSGGLITLEKVRVIKYGIS